MGCAGRRVGDIADRVYINRTSWSKWWAYPTAPQADTFEGGEGYELII